MPSLDLFFKGRKFLISVGKQYGLIHVLPLETRHIDNVAKAIRSIIQDYQKNQKQVHALFSEEVKGSTESVMTDAVRATESDNEAGFLDAAIRYLSDKNIISIFVPSGEHMCSMSNVLFGR